MPTRIQGTNTKVENYSGTAGFTLTFSQQSGKGHLGVLAIAMVAGAGGGITPNTPSGWTLKCSAGFGDTNLNGSIFFYGIGDIGTITSLTVTTANGTCKLIQAYLEEWAGLDINIAGEGNATATGTATSTLSSGTDALSKASDFAIALLALGNYQVSGGTTPSLSSPTNGYTLGQSLNDSGSDASFNYFLASALSYNLAVPGANASTTLTSNVAGSCAGGLFAVRPAKFAVVAEIFSGPPMRGAPWLARLPIEPTTVIQRFTLSEEDVWAPGLWIQTLPYQGVMSWSTLMSDTPWNPVLFAYEEELPNAANFYTEEVAAPLPAVQQVPWTAYVATDDEIFSAASALDEGQPSPALYTVQTIAWNGRAFSDNDEGAQLVNLPVDDESPPSAPRQSTSTYYAIQSTVFADEDTGAALVNLPVDEEYSPPLRFTQTWTAVAFADDEIAANLPPPLGVDDEANPFPPSTQGVGYRGALFQEDDIAAAPIIFFASDDESAAPPASQIVTWTSPKAFADDEIAARLKNFGLDEEQAPIPPAPIITWARPPVIDDDAPLIVLSAVDDEAAAVTPQSLTWTAAPYASGVFADEDPGINLSIVHVDDEAAYAPQRPAFGGVTWTAFVVADEEASVRLANFALEDEPASTPQTTTVTWAARIATDDEISSAPQVPSDADDVWLPLAAGELPRATAWDTKIVMRASSEGVRPANFPLDDEANQPPAATTSTWTTATLFSDEGDWSPRTAQLADDESAPLPQAQQIVWRGAVFADEHAAAALANFGIDQEEPWSASGGPAGGGIAVSWLTSKQLASTDEESGAQLPIGEEIYWLQPAIQQVAWRAVVFMDEDAGPQLAAFGLEEESPFVAVVQPAGGGPRGWSALGGVVFTTDEERFTTYWSPIDDDVAVSAQRQLISWCGWVFTDSDEGVQFFVAGVPPQKIKDIHAPVQYVSGSTGQSRVKGKYAPTQQITGRYGG